MENPEILIFESGVQVSGRDGETIIKAIISLAQKLKVSAIFTAAAFSQPMSHNVDSQVMMACNNPFLFNELSQYNITSMPDGYITGMNGLILGIAKGMRIDSCCLLGTIPSYATSISYPKASLEIVNSLEKIHQFSVDHTDLEENITLLNQQLEVIEDRIKEYLPSIVEKEEDMKDVEDSEVPRFIMEKIEKMFLIVKEDKSRAGDLKRELDRWNIYELYEHRFLNLFKSKK